MSPLDGIKLFAKGAKVMKNATDELSENQQLRPSSSVQSIGNFVSVFMAGRNCPQCLMTETPVPPEAILNACRNFLGSKCAVTQTTTEDSWQLLWAVKKKSLFLNDQHVCFVAVSTPSNSVTRVVIGCRLTETGKIDVFGTYKKMALGRVNEIAKVIGPNSGLSKVNFEIIE